MWYARATACHILVIPFPRSDLILSPHGSIHWPLVLPVRHSLGVGGSAREARVSKDAACFDRAQHRTFGSKEMSKHPGLSLPKAHHERAFTQLISGNGINRKIYEQKDANRHQ
jgi:hypothetical protein